MTYKPHILLGKISRVNGYDGSVIIRLEKFFIDNLPEMESVFVETDGKPVPFFISSTDYNGSDILKVKFEGYESGDKAGEFSGCRVFLTAGDGKVPKAGRSGDIEGFKVFLQESEFIGTVSSIIENPGQDLFSILSPDGREILVPLHDDFIIGIDWEKKTIRLSLPEGLIDLN
ncbi:MAG TPA: ribosome maturation factor RimM [Bacteroidales bacterium]|nr:ribosome maturation factor RimM [Bacteroidales bacterium]